jgi:hypothetical protein
MKTSIRRTALTSIAILMLLGGTTAAFADSPQTLNATLVGGVTNLGTQIYNFGGGQVVGGFIGGSAVDPSATIQYSVQATQDGPSTRGSASLKFSETVGGVPIGISGTFNVIGADAAYALPNGCTTSCQSVLPFDFVATSSDVQLTQGTATTTTPVTLLIESPYMNPFGGPLYIMSMGADGTPDGLMYIAATYTQGTILWMGSQTGGSVTGTLNGTPVSGSFSQTSYEYENLVTGNAYDAGTIRFSSVTPSSLNAQGFYSGTSTSPTTGAIDCSSWTGMPGTCYMTGFQSNGHFKMGGISGTYQTTWGVPAIGFQSTVLASVTQTGNQQHGFFGFLP